MIFELIKGNPSLSGKTRLVLNAGDWREYIIQYDSEEMSLSIANTNNIQRSGLCERTKKKYNDFSKHVPFVVN